MENREHDLIWQVFKDKVIELMAKLPQKFELVFEEFYIDNFSLESIYKDGKAIFRINTNKCKENLNKYAKLAVLLFIDDYFDLSAGREIKDNTDSAYQAITFLID